MALNARMDTMDRHLVGTCCLNMINYSVYNILWICLFSNGYQKCLQYCMQLESIACGLKELIRKSSKRTSTT